VALKPKVNPSDIQQKINTAFQRTASIDSNRISVDVVGNKVILRGKVRSFAEKEDAESAVWSAPGVANVECKLEVEEPEFAF
jgi:osmotically-inducible protein OsmY